LFGDLGEAVHKFETEAMTSNNHGYGVDPEKYTTDPGLAEMYELTSISYEPDRPFRPFAASVEGKKYPFFGV